MLGDPHLDNPTWDRLFKTGYIDTNAAVRNVLPGVQPVFQIRTPNSLQTTPARWGNLGKIIRDNGQSNASRSLQFAFRFMF